MNHISSKRTIHTNYLTLAFSHT